jgi:hypothetical protein
MGTTCNQDMGQDNLPECKIVFQVRVIVKFETGPETLFCLFTLAGEIRAY